MLEIKQVTKFYEGQPLLQGVSFAIQPGETACLLGASGSGKSTLLRLVAGLEAPDGGEIRWQGRSVLGVPAHRRQFGLMFQDYALFPHLDVFENVAFGLHMQGQAKNAIGERVASVLELVRMETFARRRVAELSGGEQQRVALARALAPNPRLLMLDEPLGALDRALKENLLEELRGILKQAGIPAMYVTHDQREAFAVADTILLLHEGRIHQAGSPAQVAAEPASAWAAGFLGLGNLLDLTVERPGVARSRWGDLAVDCGHAHRAGESLRVLVRPSTSLTEGEQALQGVPIDVVFDGEKYVVTLEGGLVVWLQAAPMVGQALDFFVKRAQCLGGSDEDHSE
jgi:ABC-type Fe3+/spermidine/putrescine transport system ATPase subunit